MLEKYSYVRRRLARREEELEAAARRTSTQEEVVAELRAFIESRLGPAFEIYEQVGDGIGTTKYVPGQAVRAARGRDAPRQWPLGLY